MDDFVFDVSVEGLGGVMAAVVTVPSDLVFREKERVTAVPLGDSGDRYIPWGPDNMLPYRIIDRVEEDETLTVCHDFQSEALFADGLEYVADENCPELVLDSVREFCLDNDLSELHLGLSRDLRLFEFCVTLLVLSMDGTRIVGMYRKEAAYCRFSEPDSGDGPEYVYYANWRLPVTGLQDVERIRVVDGRMPYSDLKQLGMEGYRKVALVTRVPGKDSLLYPIPSHAAIFRGRWYAIKRAIAVAKEAAIRNSTRLKYLIEINDGYWKRYFTENHIVDLVKKQEAVNALKQQMIDFITGAENSGKALFASYLVTPDGREVHDVKITSVESQKEGGDWSADHAEAVNMICFALRVHSNLVGSVPGKSQMNNSGSDKRELYLISQAMMTPYRRCLARIHKLVIAYNGWRGVRASMPLLQLTTLDEHKDIKTVE